MKETIVKSQAALDAIDVDYDGRIKIECASTDWIAVKKRYKYSVEACDNSSVTAWGNSSVAAWGNSSVEAYDNSSVAAWGNSSVTAYGNSSVEAWGNSSVTAYGNSSVTAYGNSSVTACDNSSVEAYGNSSVTACDNSSVAAWGNSSVEAWGNSSVTAYGNSSVEARDNSSVEAWGNCQVLVAIRSNKNITVHANARIVYNPANIEEWADWHGIPITDGKIKLYKAVHKIRGMYFADYNRDFEYTIGETAVADCFNLDNTEECGHGIHLTVKPYAVDYGKGWADMAILELEADASEVVVPLYNCWKVRAPKAKVLREVPLSELGKMGEFYAKRHNLKSEDTTA